MAQDADTIKIVNLLVEVAKLDTVYRDLHLRRARELLSSTLDEASYRARRFKQSGGSRVVGILDWKSHPASDRHQGRKWEQEFEGGYAPHP